MAGDVVSSVPAEDVAKIRKAARDYFQADSAESAAFNKAALGEVLADLKRHSCNTFSAEMKTLAIGNAVGGKFDENVRVPMVKRDASKQGIDRVDFAWEPSPRSWSDWWNNVPPPKVNPGVSFDLSKVKCGDQGAHKTLDEIKDALKKKAVEHILKK